MRHSPRRSIGILLLCVVLAAIFVTVNASAATRAEKREQVESQLKNAATAEESYLTTHEAYTRVLNRLKEEGYRSNPRVAVIIDRAGTRHYCIEAQHAGLGEIWHYSSSEGMPRPGRC